MAISCRVSPLRETSLGPVKPSSTHGRPPETGLLSCVLRRLRWPSRHARERFIVHMASRRCNAMNPWEIAALLKPCDSRTKFGCIFRKQIEQSRFRPPAISAKSA